MKDGQVIDATERFRRSSEERHKTSIAVGQEALALVVAIDDWQRDSEERLMYIAIINGLRADPSTPQALIEEAEQIICDGQDRGDPDVYILDSVHECVVTFEDSYIK